MGISFQDVVSTIEISFQDDEESVFIGDMDISLYMTIDGDGYERSLTTLKPTSVSTSANIISIDENSLSQDANNSDTRLLQHTCIPYVHGGEVFRRR